MRFAPKSREEVETANLLDPGLYKFRVIESEDKISQAGADMIKLKLSIIDSEGIEHIVFDYLLESMLFKILHFCDTTDLTSKYESGTLGAKDCIDKEGCVSIIIQKSKDPMYSDKNSVKDYKCMSEYKPTEKKKSQSQINKEDDSLFDEGDLPF